jgi:hypothetical protein
VVLHNNNNNNKQNTTAHETGNLSCEKRTQNVYFNKRLHFIKILRYDVDVSILLLLFNSSASSF